MIPTTELVKLKPLLCEKTLEFTFYKSVNIPLSLGLFLQFRFFCTHRSHTLTTQSSDRCAYVNPTVEVSENTLIWTNVFHSKVRNEGSRYKVFKNGIR